MPEDKIPPNAESYGYRVIGWLREASEEADNFLRSQVGYNKIDESINAIMGELATLRSSTLSTTECNLLSKTFFDMAAGLTDVKPFWEYKTYNKRFESNCSIYGKLSEHVWLQRHMDLNFVSCVQYALCSGSSYFEPYWDNKVEDMRAEAWDPRDVLPIRPSVDWSLQDCYGVLSRKARSVNHVRYLAKHVYNREDLVKYILPDRDGSVVGQSLRNTRVGQLLQRMGDSPFRQRLFGEKAVRDIARIPTVDLYTAYIDDDTTNDSTQPVYMGAFDKSTKQPLNNWSHVVQPGDRLYPRKRLIVYTSGAPEPLYDGPSPYWHGMFPFPKLMLDPVPWSFLGKGAMWDLLPLNKALNKLLRAYDDWVERLVRPDIYADKSIPNHLIERMDTRRAGKKLRASMLQKGTIQVVGPDPLPADFWKGVEYYENKHRELSGSQDISSLMKLNQVPSSDSIEQIIESMSLMWRLRSRFIEVFMREFATMLAYNFTQFYTLPKRLTILGGAGVVPSDFHMDPGSLVPDFVHAEDFDENGIPKAVSLARGPLPRYDRATEFLRQFTFEVAPGSLLASSELAQQLKYLQLSRAGLIDHWTLLDVLGIPNVGTPPPGTNSITERLLKEQELGLGMQVSPTGRKATGQTAPRLTVKES